MLKEGGGHNQVCTGPLPMVFKLLYLESYLRLSEETRSPTAGSEDRRGQKPQRGFLLHRGAHLPKGQGARPPPRSPALGCVFLAPSPARALRGSGEVAWRGTRAAGPSQGVAPGPGVTLVSSILDHRDIGPGQPLCIRTRGQEVFSPVLPPRAAQAQGLLQPGESRRGRLLRRRRRRRGSRAQRTGFSGHAPKPGTAPRCSQDSGLGSRVRGALAWLLPLAAGLRPQPNAQRAGGLRWVQEG